MNKQQNKVWFITGASQGIGLSLTRQLLEQGYRVAATSRNLDQLQQAISSTHNSFLPLALNITDEASVTQAIAQTIETFGQIDYVVNNAGYGLIGSLEELSDQEARQNFDVNVFGSLNIIRATLPHLRQQGFGHIFNISSIAGMSGDYPGFGIYCATKFAVIGFTEALAMEVKDFNIKVTAVLPGYIRTNFLKAGSVVTAKKQLPKYQSTREMQRLHQEQINGNQPGDPEKAVAAIINAAQVENPPLHLLLGSDALELATNKLYALQAEFAQWAPVSQSVDFAVEA
ncbi:SDR family NAD(P)-dependent oxidoreductase [Adhaeribacter swui]|uniref:SDR family NAD(P)-dependent oxidoreductase n=1 Tax=Adhaeribacter swui TaxID=2086471 RepID=A0A7G7G7Q4_9BACT|nr:oxidoreductase [Adhaeribacter swui]QNF33188.1 SDR family NAD(P)-dependent oxidoreductase [Adhaeribacter swui]